jgi:hypothetical protein
VRPRPCVAPRRGRFRPWICGAPSSPLAPPSPGVLTRWRSRRPARGWAARPRVPRSGSRPWAGHRPQTGAFRHRRKACDPVFPGGPSWGKHRHGPPVRRPSNLALRMARPEGWRGRPGVPAPGRRGSSRCHASSVRSVGEERRSRPVLYRLDRLLYPLFRQFLSSTFALFELLPRLRGLGNRIFYDEMVANLPGR